MRRANDGFRRVGGKKLAHRQQDFQRRRGNEKLSLSLMLTDSAMIAVVLTAAVLSGGNLRTSRLTDGDDGYRRGVVIVVFNPLVQSLAKQRNYAVAKESCADCEAMEHRKGSAKILGIRNDVRGNRVSNALTSTPAIELHVVYWGQPARQRGFWQNCNWIAFTLILRKFLNSPSRKRVEFPAPDRCLRNSVDLLDN